MGQAMTAAPKLFQSLQRCNCRFSAMARSIIETSCRRPSQVLKMQHPYWNIALPTVGLAADPHSIQHQYWNTMLPTFGLAAFQCHQPSALG